ncbi:MAG: hypothetical protein M1829_000555 [Trizodia sp. TS-e1964]|nr:MAG: hypothetical protein M1829_000555 [Trizodia sp. TS-e1964]
MPSGLVNLFEKTLPLPKVVTRQPTRTSQHSSISSSLGLATLPSPSFGYSPADTCMSEAELAEELRAIAALKLGVLREAVRVSVPHRFEAPCVDAKPSFKVLARANVLKHRKVVWILALAGLQICLASTAIALAFMVHDTTNPAEASQAAWLAISLFSDFCLLALVTLLYRIRQDAQRAWILNMEEMARGLCQDIMDLEAEKRRERMEFETKGQAWESGFRRDVSSTSPGSSRLALLAQENTSYTTVIPRTRRAGQTVIQSDQVPRSSVEPATLLDRFRWLSMTEEEIRASVVETLVDRNVESPFRVTPCNSRRPREAGNSWAHFDSRYAESNETLASSARTVKFA